MPSPPGRAGVLSPDPKEFPGGPESKQLIAELDYFIRCYPGLQPAMFVSYDRYSLASPTDSILRITFDRNITWRLHDLDLKKGVFGQQLDLGGRILMELKIPEAMPLWLSHTFDDLNIRMTSFSKYGRAYLKALESGLIDPARGVRVQ